MTTTTIQPPTLASGRGKLTLLLLCAIAFLDFVDGVIVNVALPAIRDDLGFSVQALPWVLTAYLLTYGGFMLLGGRAADLLGRRRVLLAGMTAFALASTIGGFAATAEVLVGAQLLQGAAAALMLPAALSILTTTFREGSDRNNAVGAWGGVAGAASAAGVLLGGVLTDGPGWRWVLFVNPPICLVLLVATVRLIPDDRGELRRSSDIPGAVLVTSGMLLLVYTIVSAPTEGWLSLRTVGGFVGAAALLVAFVGNELRCADPLVPMSIFRIKGLAAADITQLVAVAGILSVFLFLTLYMQNVLGYSPLQTGLAYLPTTIGVGVAAGLSSQLISRFGTRPIAAVGATIASIGMGYLSTIPVDGSYVTDVLPGLLVMSIGLGSVFVAVTAAANAGVPADKSGLAAALLNSSQQLGGALGIAVFSAIASAHTKGLLTAGQPMDEALTSGFRWGLFACSMSLLAAASLVFRTHNTRG